MELDYRNANGSSSTSGPRAAVQETSRAIGEQAKQTAESAKDQIRSLAEVGKDRVADQLEQVAHALRQTGDNLRSEEQEDLSRYTETIGDQIERASRYLREHQAIDLVDGVERFARTQPALFLGGAFVLGLAVGRFLKSSAPPSTRIDEGYDMRGYDLQLGYPEPEEAVRTAPMQSVGTPPTQNPAPGYPAPSGTFRGPGSDQS